MEMHCMPKNGENGFSLMEVLIAIMMFGFGVIAIAALQGTALKGNAVGRHYTEATTIAIGCLENLSALPWTDAQLQDVTADDIGGLDNGFGAKEAVAPDQQTVDGNYTVFWNIAESQLVAETKTVAMYVTWQDRGVSRSVRMRYIIPRRY
jgi:type IV pilus assembly protein PilV